MSQNDDKFLLLLDKMTEIGERTVRMEVEQRNMKEDLTEVKLQDIRQNQLLAEHIKGVATANLRLDNEIKVREAIQTQYSGLQGRVESLEKTPKFFKSVYSVFIYAGAIIGVIYEVGRILHKW